MVLSVRPSVAYISNNSRTHRPSLPKFGMKVPHLRCDSHTIFKVKRSKVRVARPKNADTSYAILSSGLPNANLPNTAGCCCLAYFSAISVPICTKLARNILMTENIVTEPNFENRFPNLEFCRQKLLFVNFGVWAATLACCYRRSIDR